MDEIKKTARIIRKDRSGRATIVREPPKEARRENAGRGNRGDPERKPLKWIIIATQDNGFPPA